MAAVAGEHRFRPLEHFVGHRIDGPGQAAKQAGHITVPGVDVGRDLLQVHHQQALKPDELGQHIVQQRQRACDRGAGIAGDRRVSIQMIDDCRIERLLLFEHGGHRAADDGGEPAAQPRNRRIRVELPQRVERRNLMFVGAGRRMWEIGGQPLNGMIEAGQRLVVRAIGRLTLGLQRREVVGVRHLIGHDRQRPTIPSIGLLAVAYIFRGILPAR